MPFRKPKYSPLHKPPQGAKINLGHPLAKGLVAAYVMNEARGLVARDLSGNNNTGVLSSGMGWKPGTKGIAMNFPGGTDDVSIGPSATMNALSNVTMSFVVEFKLDGATNFGAEQILLMIGDIMFSSIIFGISKNFAGGNNQLWYLIPGRDNYYGVTQLLANVWYQATFVRTNDSNITMYLNGVFETSQSIETGHSFHTGNSVLLNGGNGYWSNGDKQCVAIVNYAYIYSIALTATQVKQIYEKPFAFMVPPRIGLRQSSGAAPVYNNNWIFNF